MLKSRLFLVLIGVILVSALVSGGAFLGYRLGERHPLTIKLEDVANAETGKPGTVDFGEFWQAWSVIRENYLKDKDIAAQAKIYGAIKGLVASLGDPHSEFFTPEENKKFQEDIRGKFGGIGAEIGIRSNQLVVVAPLKDTPASRAGLRANDKILLINSSSTEGLTVNAAVQMIRGEEGTQVKLTILREGWDAPKEFEITRAAIIIPTLDLTMKEGDITYIQLYSFNENANRLFYEAIYNASKQNAKGVILDLRNNPGGFLEVSVDLAGWFLPRGTLVVSEATRTEVSEEFKANGNAALAEIPTVIIINGGSASASEILAGALRDQRQIKLVGETSYGKGTVQQIIPLKNDSTIKLTIAHWVLPGGQILETGLKPDYEVKLTEKDAEDGKDPQLDKAIEVLRSEITNS